MRAHVKSGGWEGQCKGGGYGGRLLGVSCGGMEGGEFRKCAAQGPLWGGHKSAEDRARMAILGLQSCTAEKAVADEGTRGSLVQRGGFSWSLVGDGDSRAMWR